MTAQLERLAASMRRSNRTRKQVILEELERGPATAVELAACLRLRRNICSAWLAWLHSRGLVQVISTSGQISGHRSRVYGLKRRNK